MQLLEHYCYILHFNKLISLKALGDYKMFNRASPLATLSALNFDPVFELLESPTPSFRGRKLLEHLESRDKLKCLNLISANNHICFVIIKTIKSGDCNLGPTVGPEAFHSSFDDD